MALRNLQEAKATLTELNPSGLFQKRAVKVLWYPLRDVLHSFERM
jgi:hypothetical protein